ncbi:MAG: hypothetical protein ACO1PI_03985 [Bacteroidota bacterium]
MSTMPPVLEKKILTSLLFTESFETILEETKQNEFLVANVLKWLITRRYVTPMKYSETKKDYEPSFIYDSDNMRAFHYRITAEGLKFIGTKF